MNGSVADVVEFPANSVTAQHWKDRALKAESELATTKSALEAVESANRWLHGEIDYLKNSGLLTLAVGFVCGAFCTTVWVVAWGRLWPWGA